MKPYNDRFITHAASASLLLSSGISIIVHTVVFLINPSFTFTFGEKWEDSKGRFLSVELRKGERKALERGSGVQGHPFKEGGQVDLGTFTPRRLCQPAGSKTEIVNKVQCNLKWSITATRYSSISFKWVRTML